MVKRIIFTPTMSEAAKYTELPSVESGCALVDPMEQITVYSTPKQAAEHINIVDALDSVYFFFEGRIFDIRIEKIMKIEQPSEFDMPKQVIELKCEIINGDDDVIPF